MDKKTILITTGSIIAIIGFLYGAYYFTSKPEMTDFPQLKEVKATDHTKWSKEKKHVLVEYSDFQCPACQAYSQILKEVGKDKTITSNITFVYRHFPLDNLHPNARAGAYAAEAAGMQGKFFEMHDMLFINQGQWSESSKPTDVFKKYAAAMKLDINTFDKDYSSNEVKQAVQNDLLTGRDVNVQGTPSFYLDGKKIDNPQSIDAFKQILHTVIK